MPHMAFTDSDCIHDSDLRANVQIPNSSVSDGTDVFRSKSTSYYATMLNGKTKGVNAAHCVVSLFQLLSPNSYT